MILVIFHSNAITFRDFTDIDLFVGGALEEGIQTFKHLNALQFYHWKFGDRFYFEHSKQAGSFTRGGSNFIQSEFKFPDNHWTDQLEDIRKSGSMANLLCKTTGFDSFASNPFSLQSESNPEVFCRNLNDINYNLFRQ